MQVDISEEDAQAIGSGRDALVHIYNDPQMPEWYKETMEGYIGVLTAIVDWYYEMKALDGET